MIIIEKVDVVGWEPAIRGMRNPLNSWDKMDSDFSQDILGYDDLSLAKKLREAGTDHRKYLRMIDVYLDITAPLYWWKEFDTYKVGTVANSCSTMHKIHSKEFTLEDFSCEHLSKGEYGNIELMKSIIMCLNNARKWFNTTKDKEFWWQMIQLLPSSYNQKRTVKLNYEVLCNIYKSRNSHKLDEWREFCRWIETLPYSELITGHGNQYYNL